MIAAFDGGRLGMQLCRGVNGSVVLVQLTLHGNRQREKKLPAACAVLNEVVQICVLHRRFPPVFLIVCGLGRDIHSGWEKGDKRLDKGKAYVVFYSIDG